MRITVIGTGYLGAVHAACMAEIGHEVLGVDVDAAKIDRPRRGPAAVLRAGPARAAAPRPSTPGSAALHRLARRRRREFGEVHFVCVGTPQQPGSYAADLRHVDAVVDGLAPHLRRGSLVVGKSTVPVGTAARLAARVAELAPRRRRRGGVEPGVPARGLRGAGHADARTGWSSASRRPRADADAARGLRPDARGGYPVHQHRPGHRRAGQGRGELLPRHQDLVHQRDGRGVRRRRRRTSSPSPTRSATTPRIGRRFLSAGLGFGGGCLPKDIRAFMARAGELGVGEALAFLRRSTRSTCGAGSAPSTSPARWSAARSSARSVAVLGAAFKPDSDDVRDSPALNVAALHPAAGRPGPGARPGGASTTPARCSRRWTTRCEVDEGLRAGGPRPAPHRVGGSTASWTRRSWRRSCGHRGSSTGATRSTRRAGAPRGGPCARWAARTTDLVPSATKGAPPPRADGHSAVGRCAPGVVVAPERGVPKKSIGPGSTPNAVRSSPRPITGEVGARRSPGAADGRSEPGGAVSDGASGSARPGSTAAPTGCPADRLLPGRRLPGG